MKNRKQRTSQNLVQVSTYIPYERKVQLQTLAEAQDISTYELFKKIINDFIEQAEKRGLVQKVDDAPTGNDEELLG